MSKMKTTVGFWLDGDEIMELSDPSFIPRDGDYVKIDAALYPVASVSYQYDQTTGGLIGEATNRLSVQVNLGEEE